MSGFRGQDACMHVHAPARVRNHDLRMLAILADQPTRSPVRSPILPRPFPHMLWRGCTLQQHASSPAGAQCM